MYTRRLLVVLSGIVCIVHGALLSPIMKTNFVSRLQPSSLKSGSIENNIETLQFSNNLSILSAGVEMSLDHVLDRMLNGWTNFNDVTLTGSEASIILPASIVRSFTYKFELTRFLESETTSYIRLISRAQPSNGFFSRDHPINITVKFVSSPTNILVTFESSPTQPTAPMNSLVQSLSGALHTNLLRCIARIVSSSSLSPDSTLGGASSILPPPNTPVLPPKKTSYNRRDVRASVNPNAPPISTGSGVSAGGRKTDRSPPSPSVSAGGAQAGC